MHSHVCMLHIEIHIITLFTKMCTEDNELYKIQPAATITVTTTTTTTTVTTTPL